MLWRVTLKALNRRYRAGRWSQQLCADSEALTFASPNEATLRFHLLVRHSLVGVSCAHIQYLAETLPPSLLLDPSITPLVLSLVDAPDSHGDTHHNRAPRVDNNGPHDHDIQGEPFRNYGIQAQQSLARTKARELMKYPALLSNMDAGAWSSRHNVQRPRRHAQQLITNTSPLREHLARMSGHHTGHKSHPETDYQAPQSANHSIAIVGNSPSAAGLGAGEEIDQHDTVIRFNHASVENRFQPDYGTQTHVHVISPAYRFGGNPPLCHTVAVSGVQPFHRPGKFWQHLASQQDHHYLTFDPSVWYDLVTQLEAPPSAGLLCASQCAQLRQQGVSVNLFGFGQSEQANNHYSDRDRKSERHNWAAEETVLASLRQQADPTLASR